MSLQVQSPVLTICGKYRLQSTFSCEPLLESLGDLNLVGVEWVIVGGESGPKARPMREEWVQDIERPCDNQGSAFFFKQWGTWGSDGIKRNKHANGKLLNGKVIQEMLEK